MAQVFFTEIFVSEFQSFKFLSSASPFAVAGLTAFLLGIVSCFALAIGTVLAIFRRYRVSIKLIWMWFICLTGFLSIAALMPHVGLDLTPDIFGALILYLGAFMIMRGYLKKYLSYSD